MSKPKLQVRKASGDLEPFNAEKLRTSLKRAGAKDETIREILEQVNSNLYDGISTKEVYKTAFAMLKTHNGSTAARYNLKRALMMLGPSGYPFEKYVGEILKHEGFKVEVGVIIHGHCVDHEVDVVAEKDDSHFMVECKFHNQPGHICDVKVPLYINSRFHDIEKQWKLLPGHGTKFHQGWVVTNTRFSNDAIQYGSCAGLHLIGWNYPESGSLRMLIDESGLHPVTALTTLSQSEKIRLLENRVVLGREIVDDPTILTKIGVKGPRANAIIAEAGKLCAIHVV
jgi:hypothetical protein